MNYINGMCYIISISLVYLFSNIIYFIYYSYMLYSYWLIVAFDFGTTKTCTVLESHLVWILD